MKIAKKTVPYIIIILFFAAGLLLFQNLGTGTDIEKQSGQKTLTDGKLTVEVQKAKITQELLSSTYDASLMPLEEGTVGAKVPGQVLQLLFKEGDRVKGGDPLIVLDSQDLNNQLSVAQSQLEVITAGLPKAEASLESSQRNYDHTKSLFDGGAASQANVDDTETALKVARADLEILKANIQVSEQGIRALQDSLANMVIKAPCDGIMDQKSVEVGQYVSPGIPLAKVINISVINAVFKIDQTDVSKIKIGQAAKVTLSGSGDKVYSAAVSYIGTTANAASRTFDCKVEVLNPNGQLKPGIFAKVDLDGGEKTQSLVIPVKAVLGSEGGYYVFTDENGVARRHDVTLGETHNDLMEVKSGIQDGDSVICTNINSLEDGIPISAITAQEE